MAAADFYFALNATFRHIHKYYGLEGLHAYWRALAEEYFAELRQRFEHGGLDEVEKYLRKFYQDEPVGQVTVRREGQAVIIDVHQCPAIKHLQAHGREVMEHYCKHCRVIGEELVRPANLSFKLDEGGDHCRQVIRVQEG